MSEKQGEEKEDKLFGKWSFSGIQVKDVGLRNVICLKPVYLPHSGGRHEHRRFAKTEVNIIERLINKMMRPGKNCGKKAKAISIVKRAFEIIHLKTGKNPIEVLVRAIENAAPREEITRIAYGGVVYHVAVDVSPSRRVDLALRFITDGARLSAFSNPKTIEECLADEIIAAAENDASRSYAIRKKEELERIALSAR